MFRRLLQATVIAAAGLFAAHGAFANPYTQPNVYGSVAFQDSSAPNNLVLTDAFGSPVKNSTGNFKFYDAVGSTVSFTDFITICTDLTSGTSGTDNIALAFNITAPGSGSGTITGTAGETITTSGRYDKATETIAWDSATDPLAVTLGSGANSYTLTIDLHDATMQQSVYNNNCDSQGYRLCTKVRADFTLAQNTSTGGDPSGNPPVGVPEPGSMALMGSALLGLGFIGMMQRRRA